MSDDESLEGGAPAPAVLVDDDDAIRVVTLANPVKKNALTRGMLDALGRALVVHEPSKGPRVVVLQGDARGGAFSSGFDVSTIDDDERARGLDPIAPVVDAIRACPIPVLAVLDGPAMGGALEIALATTLRVGGPRLRIMMPPARLGLVYAPHGLEVFLRVLAPGQVARLFLTGRALDADEALRIGAVDVLVDDARGEARALAAAIAAHAPLAVRGMTLALHRADLMGRFSDDDRAAIEAVRAASLASEDLEEGVRAFVEKRPPVFRGR